VRLSVFVITLNEEHNLERCLQSVHWADEIVVVDSGSTDATLEIARRFTDRVIVRPFRGFGEQKAAALAETSGDWVLNLDADEAVSEELASQIQKLLNGSPKACGYVTPRLTYYLGRPIRHCGWYPDYQLRLFARQHGRYPQRRVHERVQVDGPLGKLTGHIEHYGFPSFEEHFRKMTDYARAAALQMRDEGRAFRVSDLLCRPGLEFIRKFVLQQGFRDGVRGGLVSMMHSYYVFLKYAWLWELERTCSRRNDSSDNRSSEGREH